MAVFTCGAYQQRRLSVVKSKDYMGLFASSSVIARGEAHSVVYVCSHNTRTTWLIACDLQGIDMKGALYDIPVICYTGRK